MSSRRSFARVEPARQARLAPRRQDDLGIALPQGPRDAPISGQKTPQAEGIIQVDPWRVMSHAIESRQLLPGHEQATQHDADFPRQARARLEALEWAVVQQVDGVPDYARFIRAYPESVWVPQAQARLTELEEQDTRRQDTNARVNCPQLQDRVRAYTTAVEQTLEDMTQLPPDKRQQPRLNATDLPHLPRVFRAIRDYQNAVAAVQVTYGTLPPCHLPHKEIAYLALPTTGGHMLLHHLPVYGPLRGETIWQILE